MKDGQKLKLGDAHITPIHIQEVKESKLGDAQGIPFFINKNIRSSFKTLYFYCFIWYVLFLERQLFLFSVCLILFVCNKSWLDSRILLWERDTLRFFIRILLCFTYICWVFLPRYFSTSSSCFACISCSELLAFVVR